MRFKPDRKALFYIAVEALFIFCVVIIGEFVWENGQEIFNSDDWWATLVFELKEYWYAYLTVGVLGFIAAAILYYRIKRDEREDVNKKLDTLIANVNALTNEIRADRESRRQNEQH